MIKFDGASVNSTFSASRCRSIELRREQPANRRSTIFAAPNLEAWSWSREGGLEVVDLGVEGLEVIDGEDERWAVAVEGSGGGAMGGNRKLRWRGGKLRTCGCSDPAKRDILKYT